MRAFVGGRWEDGFLDYHRRAEECRLRVVAQRELADVEDLYFVPVPSLRLLADYAAEVGPSAVLRKVRSRLRERGRNEKVVSVGVAEVLEADDAARVPAGAVVAFVAPAHPRAVERICLPPELLRPGRLPSLEAGPLLRLSVDADDAPSDAIAALAGWNSESGVSLEGAEWAVDALVAMLDDSDWRAAEQLDMNSPTPVEELRRGKPQGGRRTKPTASLFGYGNYAKSYTLPGVRGALDVRTVHELDPLQLGSRLEEHLTLDSAPWSRRGEHHDAWLIASYHHTHAPLAVAGLRDGAAVVLEKPLATDHEALRELIDAMGTNQGRLFACFQRRYSELTAYALADLGGTARGPVSYHCVVHEVPLPSRHWYRWPASRSRVVSNGCHWVDHFLFVNEFARVTDRQVFTAKDETTVCVLELENGAVFSMVLTERGSSRTGVQDHVELRTADRTVRIVNDSRYAAESTAGPIRRARQRRTRSYERMYGAIAQRIVRGDRGDTVASVRSSAATVLELEDALARTRGAVSPTG